MAIRSPLGLLRRSVQVMDILSTGKREREIEMAFLARFAEVVVRAPRRHRGGSLADFEHTLHAMHDPVYVEVARRLAKDVHPDHGFDAFGSRPGI